MLQTLKVPLTTVIFNLVSNYMNQLLDIDELVSETKRQESNRLNLFESVLIQCHDLIKRHHKDRIREMHYKIPPWMIGKPRYDVDVLRNYLVGHLKDNGLRVDVIDRYTIYISWKETDIDLTRYVKRKARIDNYHSDLYMADTVAKPMDPKRIKLMKFRQERQKQLKEERQQRFELQKARMPPLPDMSYHDYVNKY